MELDEEKIEQYLEEEEPIDSYSGNGIDTTGSSPEDEDVEEEPPTVHVPGRDPMDLEDTEEVEEFLDEFDTTFGFDGSIVSTMIDRVRGGRFFEEVPEEPEHAILIGDIPEPEDRSALREAEDISVHAGTVDTDDVGWSMKDSAISAGKLRSRKLLRLARDTVLDAGTISSSRAFRGAEGVVVDAGSLRISQDRYDESHLMESADRTVVDVEEAYVHGDILEHSTDSYLLADTLEVDGRIGDDATGSVLAAKSIDPYMSAREKGEAILGDGSTYVDISDDISVITADDREGAVQYTGDWEELSAFVEQAVLEGRFRDMGPFQLPDRIENVGELDAVLDEIDALYDESIEEAYSVYEDASDYFTIAPLDGPNEAIAERLRGMEYMSDGLSTKFLKDPEEGVLLSLSHSQIRYAGEWEDLQDELDRYDVSVDRDALRLFDLPDEVSSIAELEEYIDRIEEWYDEVEDEHSQYRRFRMLLDLPALDGPNEERYETLKEFDKTVAEHVDWLSEESAEILLESSNQQYLLDHRGKFLRKDLPERLKNPVRAVPVSMTMDEFLQTFGSDDQFDYVDEPGFERTYYITPDDEIRTEEEHTDWRSEGLELLREIRDGARKFDGEPLYRREIDRLLEEKQEIGQRIGKVARGEMEGDKETLIDQRRKIDEQIEELKDEAREEYFERLSYSLDDGDVPGYRVVRTLEQIADRHLPDNSGVYQDAKEIAKAIDDDNGAATEVSIEIWDKDLEDLPNDDAYSCCAFEGSDTAWSHGLLTYMADPATQLLEIGADDEKAMAVTYRGTDLGSLEDCLMVDSIESRTHMFSKDTVSEAVKVGIEEYAEDVGAAKVFYNKMTWNTAPQEFLSSIGEERVLQPAGVLKDGEKTIRETGVYPPVIYLNVQTPFHVGYGEDVEGYEDV
jgi:hypothetical protein